MLASRHIIAYKKTIMSGGGHDVPDTMWPDRPDVRVTSTAPAGPGFTVKALRNGWRLFSFGRLAGTPFRLVLVQPHAGVALLELEPGWTPGAMALFRRTLEESGFFRLHPGFLPVIHRSVKAEDLPHLDTMLAEAFTGLDPIHVAGEGRWADTLERILTSGSARPLDGSLPHAGGRRGPWRSVLAAGGAAALAAAVLIYAVLLPGVPAERSRLAAPPAAPPAVEAGISPPTPGGAAGLPPAGPSTDAVPPAAAVAAVEAAVDLPETRTAEAPLAPPDDAAPPPVVAPWSGRPEPVAPPSMAAETPQVVAAAPPPVVPPREPDVAPEVEPAMPLHEAAASATLRGTTLPDDDAPPPPDTVVSTAPPAGLPPPVIRPDGPAVRAAPPSDPGPPAEMPPVAVAAAPLVQARPAEAAPGPAAATPVRPPTDPALSQAMLRRGEALLRVGDISAARRFFQRAAEGGDAAAALAMAETFDPRVLPWGSIVGMQPDPVAALVWYRRAAALGAAEAASRIATLEATP